MTAREARVVVDTRMATDGGIGTYLQALVPRIARLRPGWSLSLLGNVETMQALGWGQIPNATLVACSARIFSVREQLVVPLAAARLAGDVFWAPNYNVPLAPMGRMVVTIHDVNHLALPELMESDVGRWFARTLVTSAVRRARHVLFDSEFSRRETARMVHATIAHASVVPAAVEDAWWSEGDHAPAPPTEVPYFIYLGNHKRHKNVPFLLRAFGRVRDRLPHRLVLIGRGAGLAVDPDIEREVAALGNRVTVLGEVDGATVRRHVRGAEALVTASLYEGFGLAPLEAMAAGCPCIVSTAGALPEVCGDAALYADPTDEAAFAARMLEVAGDRAKRAALVTRGRTRAAMFSWDRSAEQVVAVLEQVLA